MKQLNLILGFLLLTILFSCKKEESNFIGTFKIIDGSISKPVRNFNITVQSMYYGTGGGFFGSGYSGKTMYIKSDENGLVNVTSSEEKTPDYYYLTLENTNNYTSGSFQNEINFIWEYKKNNNEIFKVYQKVSAKIKITNLTPLNENDVMFFDISSELDPRLHSQFNSIDGMKTTGEFEVSLLLGINNYVKTTVKQNFGQRYDTRIDTIKPNGLGNIYKTIEM
jgi:hypothetical protein